MDPIAGAVLAIAMRWTHIFSMVTVLGGLLYADRSAAARAVAYVVFPVGLLWTAVSPTRRSVQDVLVRSVVVYDWRRDGGARLGVAEQPSTPSPAERI